MAASFIPLLTMDRLQKRRAGESRRRTERNKYKFITAYIQALHGDVYREAHNLYEVIKAKNPTTKDLTKTVDFVQNVTPEKKIPRHYLIRGCKQQKRLKSNTNLVLNIPLMETTTAYARMFRKRKTTTGNAPEQEGMSTLPPAIEQEGMSTLTPPIEQEEMSTLPPALEQEEEMSTLPPTLEQGDTDLFISDRMYADLLLEIAKDPDLHSIFNNFNTGSLQTGDTIDAFVADEISPLEIELQGY